VDLLVISVVVGPSYSNKFSLSRNRCQCNPFVHLVDFFDVFDLHTFTYLPVLECTSVVFRMRLRGAVESSPTIRGLIAPTPHMHLLLGLDRLPVPVPVPVPARHLIPKTVRHIGRRLPCSTGPDLEDNYSTQ
jgi:hypothetical protein